MNSKEAQSKILEKLSEFLLPLGFRRKSNAYFRDVGSIVQAVQYQRSRSSESDYLRFTINLGLHSRDIDEALGLRTDLSLIGGGIQCLVRVSHLLSSPPKDYWYEVFPETPIENVYGELERVVQGYVIPLMQRAVTNEALYDLWVTTRTLPLFDCKKRTLTGLHKVLGLPPYSEEENWRL